MKRFSLMSVFALTALLGALVFAVMPDKHFSVKEYEEFHDVLHPLEHDALPKKDFARIRSQAANLVNLGNAIVKLGVPTGTNESHVAEFNQELKRFGEALEKFSVDAERGTDDQLKTSYSSVHDSFEMLAAMLPRKSGP